MKEKMIIGLISASVIGVVIAGGVWFSNTMMWENIKNSFEGATSGIERRVEVYTYNGEKLREYEGEIFVKDGQGGTISITTPKEKHIFSNVSVIISEDRNNE